jgi:hypothetical protein
MGNMAKRVRGNGERCIGCDVVAVEAEDPALVEHSSASFARLPAFRTTHYNFRGRKNRRDQGNEEALIADVPL